MGKQSISLDPRLLISLIDPITYSIVREEVIGSFLIDSRSLTTPQGVAFVAIQTTSGDGHHYLLDLYQRGIRHFIVESDISALANQILEANWYYVRSSVKALQNIATYHRKSFDIPVVGITGSNGKTIVKEMLSHILGPEKRICRSPRSYNSQIGVPLSVLMLRSDHNLAFFEAGISRPNEMESLERMIQPTDGIFTGIGEAHQENFSSIEEKLSEKVKLFARSKSLVCSESDANLLRELELLPKDLIYHYWSYTDPSATVYIQEERRIEGSPITILEFIVQGKSHRIILPFMDRGYIHDALLTITYCAAHYPYILGERHRFLELHPLETRLEVKPSIQGNIIIDDTYSLDLTSLEIALDFQRRRCIDAHIPAAVVLSDFRECDRTPEELCYRVKQLLVDYGVSYFVGVGEIMMQYQHLFTQATATKEEGESSSNKIEYSFFPNTEALIQSRLLTEFHRTAILLKGARDFTFERLSHHLLLCQHQTILEINLSAIRKNLAYYRSLLPAGHKLICMIKADGYGLGAIELARTLTELRVDYLAVATIEEGKALRNAQILCPIIVMNPQLGNTKDLFDHRLEPEVYSFRLLRSLEEDAVLRGLQNFPIHIKLDTGMHRLGFQEEDIPTLAKELSQSKGLSVASIFSHLATADTPEQDALTLGQITLFDQMSKSLMEQLPNHPLRHILNSAGIERFADKASYDMARLGIGLYGFSPYHRQGVEPVVRLFSTILQIKRIPKGERIGYGGHCIAPRDLSIGILPIGYADGLSRLLGNGNCSFRVADKLCPTIGNICMDSCMIDLTDIPEAQEGMNVQIIDEGLPVDRIASIMGTINYEVITLLGTRLQRIYYNE